EIERSGKIDAIAAVDESPRQIERRRAVEAVAAIVESCERGLVRRPRSVHRVTLHRAEREPQREGRVGIGRMAVDREARAPDPLARRGFHAFDVPLELLPYPADDRIHLSAQDD